MRRSIHFSDFSERYIAGRKQTSLSGQVNNAFEILEFLAIENLPDLSEEEFAEVCNVYVGGEFGKIAMPLRIASDMLDYYGATVPSQCENPQLVEKLAALPQVAQFALIDKVRQFWTAASKAEEEKKQERTEGEETMFVLGKVARVIFGDDVPTNTLNFLLTSPVQGIAMATKHPACRKANQEAIAELMDKIEITFLEDWKPNLGEQGAFWLGYYKKD